MKMDFNDVSIDGKHIDKTWWLGAILGPFAFGTIIILVIIMLVVRILKGDRIND